jgi:hypothetical protein
MDKYGSHIVDRCWILVDLNMKEKIADELLMKEEMLKENPYGCFVIRNCCLDNYKRKKEAWMKKEESLEKKKNMFSEIIDDEPNHHNEKKIKLSEDIRTIPIEDRMRTRDAEIIDPIMRSLTGHMKGKILAGSSEDLKGVLRTASPSSIKHRRHIEDHLFISDPSVRY